CLAQRACLPYSLSSVAPASVNLNTVITDLVQIQRLGEKKLKENEMFRRHMKAHYFPERQFRHVAEEIEGNMDCRACANCCKVAETNISERDVEKLARFLRITPKQFVAEY